MFQQSLQADLFKPQELQSKAHAYLYYIKLSLSFHTLCHMREKNTVDAFGCLILRVIK